MRLKPGLRLRVALSLMLFSMLLMVSQTLAVFMVAEEQEQDFMDRVVAEEMQTLIEGYRRNPEFVPPQVGAVSSYIVREGASLANLPEYLRALPMGIHEIFLDDKEFHIQVRKEREANFYLIYDATRHERRIDEFRAFLLLIMLVDAVVTAALGFWLSGLLVRQVTDLASRVAKLNPGTQKRPLAQAYRDEEVVMLASAFDHYQQRVAQLIEREKEFTANASHELRTPLTLIKTGCGLLLRDINLAGKSHKRVEAMNDAADRIAESMRALLFLAREIPIGDDEAINVAEALHEAVQPFRETLAAKGVQLIVQAAPDAVVRTDRAALMLALSNLIKNAVVYTDAGKITLEYSGHTVFVRDTGCGISRDDMPHIFERAYRGNIHRVDGGGLGLAIVKRIADQFGWRVSAASEVHRGSTFSIAFPERSTGPS